MFSVAYVSLKEKQGMVETSTCNLQAHECLLYCDALCQWNDIIIFSQNAKQTHPLLTLMGNMRYLPNDDNIIELGVNAHYEYIFTDYIQLVMTCNVIITKIWPQ